MIEYNTEDQAEMSGGHGFSVKVIGVGGSGANVLDRMALEGSDEAELLTLNTDVRALSTSVSSNKIQLGATLLKGMGAGGDPELGKQAALEAVDQIRSAVRGYDMIFVCAGLGGGTGSGAAPEVCRIAKEEGIFLVVFTTLPFTFEGKRRMDQALEALDTISGYANAVITFENDRMGELIVPKDGVTEAFAAADKIISQSVRATMNIVADPGIIRIGMDDLLSALDAKDSRCLFGYGVAKGDSRAHEAIEQALKCPLLDKGKLLENARNVLVQVSGGDSMTLFEVEMVMQEVSKHIGDKTQILFGTGTDKRLGSALSVTLISSLEGPRRGGSGDDDGAGRSPAPRLGDSPTVSVTSFPHSQPSLGSPLADAVSAAENTPDLTSSIAPVAPAPVGPAPVAPVPVAPAIVSGMTQIPPRAPVQAEPPVVIPPAPAPPEMEPEVIPEPEPEPYVEPESYFEPETQFAVEPEPYVETIPEPVAPAPVVEEEFEEFEAEYEEEVEYYEEEEVVEIEEAEAPEPPVLSPQIQPRPRSVVEPTIASRPVVQPPMQPVTNPIAQAVAAAEAPQPARKRQVVPPPRRDPRPLSPFSDRDDEEINIISPETDSVEANLDNSQKIRLTRILPSETGTQRLPTEGLGGGPSQPQKRIVRKKIAANAPPRVPMPQPPVVQDDEAAQLEMLPLDSVAKGRFAKSDPTIVDGEDLDVPTFLRKRKK